MAGQCCNLIGTLNDTNDNKVCHFQEEGWERHQNRAAQEINIIIAIVKSISILYTKIKFITNKYFIF